MSETKEFILRLPENLHTWLKQNIPEGGINEFIVGLVEQHVQSLKPVAGVEQPVETRSPHELWLEKQENEIIFGNVTRGELLRKLDRNKLHYIKGIAAKLGITYKQAYDIVPLLEHEGYIIQRTKRDIKKESKGKGSSDAVKIEDFDFDRPLH